MSFHIGRFSTTTTTTILQVNHITTFTLHYIFNPHWTKTNCSVSSFSQRNNLFPELYASKGKHKASRSTVSISGLGLSMSVTRL